MTKTEEIFKLTAPYNNPHQGKEARLLFVCSAGLLRSATAAHQWSIKGFNTRACGSSGYALIPHSLNLAAWANDIFFMKQENYDEVISKWQDKGLENALESLKAKSHILDIPDIYERNHPELVKLLETQIGQYGY